MPLGSPCSLMFEDKTKTASFSFPSGGEKEGSPREGQVNSSAPWLQEACDFGNIFQI